MIGQMPCRIFVRQSRHRRGNTLVQVATAVVGRQQHHRTEEAEEALKIPLRSGEATTGSEEVPLAG